MSQTQTQTHGGSSLHQVRRIFKCQSANLPVCFARLITDAAQDEEGFLDFETWV